MKAITGGKVLTVTNGTLENATVLIENGKITAVGTDVAVPSGAEVIDAKGMWVTPGFIDAHTHMSLFGEPGSMPGTIGDGNEVSGPITPEIRALDALNPSDVSIPKVRSAGFTTCYTLPGSANIIGGEGLAFKLRGDTVDEMYIPGTFHMKMALGENPKRVYGSKQQMPVTRMGVAALLRETLFKAKNYAEECDKATEDKKPKFEFRMEALKKVIKGEQKVRIHAHRADDIQTAIRVLDEFGIDYSIEHCTEGYKIPKLLGDKGLYAVVGPLLMGPSKQELWGVKEETAAVLFDAGVKVCLSADTGSGTKWLPGQIGFLIGRGLKEEDALKGLTINPAGLLGLSDRMGSIEVGKDADLAIFNGNPFSSITRCVTTIIDGVVYDNM